MRGLKKRGRRVSQFWINKWGRGSTICKNLIAGVGKKAEVFGVASTL